MNPTHTHLARLDKQYAWHPFTQMSEWRNADPIIVTRAQGAWLYDARSRRYLDANASIWTNTHGHRHPRMVRALCRQLGRLDHSSYLGLGNEPASLLAAKLVRLTGLDRVFFSDNGSTALEVALKMSFQYWLQQKQQRPRRRYLSLQGSYHGDTLGAVSLGHVDLFDKKFQALLVKADRVMAPACYRCPFNRARPSRRNAVETRRCHWECVGKVGKKLKTRQFAALVIEPVVQGVLGMVAHPPGYLSRVAAIARRTGTLLILDEVMTGFGRTGKMFAAEHERVKPDFLCLAKGLTGGMMPLGATLTTHRVFEAFLGRYEENKTFFHGHSYTGNPLGCAAALANLDLFRSQKTIAQICRLEKILGRALERFWDLAHVGDVRQRGLIAGIELVADWRTRKPYPRTARIGWKACELARQRGVLTRPIGDAVVLMPPYCVTPKQIEWMCNVIFDCIRQATSDERRAMDQP